MKVEEELKIDDCRWDGQLKTTLVITLDCLAGILMAEEAIIDPENVAALMARICRRAEAAFRGDPRIAAREAQAYEDQVAEQDAARGDEP